MQISENLLRVIFMLSTIVAVTDCCSSRLLLLKEHTLQIVQHRFNNNLKSDDFDYEYDDYDQQLQQQQQPQQQQQKIPQYVNMANGDLNEFKQTHRGEHKRSKDHENDDDKSDNYEMDRNFTVGEALVLGDLRGMESFESFLGIFDAAAFETTTAKATIATTATTTATSTTTTSRKPEEDSATVKTTTTSTAATTTTTTTQRKSMPAQTEASTTASTSNSASKTNLGSSTSKATTTKSTIRTSDMENVMNDLKTVRDLLSLPCSGQFNTEFCLNRGRCFRYPIGNDTIHSCICADGYIGERCESKSMNGSFIPSIAGAHKRKIVMARIVFSFRMLVTLSVIYIIIGAAVVFKRPAVTARIPEPTPMTSPDLFCCGREDGEANAAAGEFIMMNSLPIAAAAAATHFATYAD